MKTKRAGKRYQCRGCDAPIEKGDDYYARSVSVGSPGKETVEKLSGYPVVVVHGFRVEHRFHAGCGVAS
tara:strand:- start:328 stop:534 length:207 start_codon:yes stop_codon:yes gene_type:complete